MAECVDGPAQNLPLVSHLPHAGRLLAQALATTWGWTRVGSLVRGGGRRERGREWTCVNMHFCFQFCCLLSQKLCCFFLFVYEAPLNEAGDCQSVVGHKSPQLISQFGYL